MDKSLSKKHPDSVYLPNGKQLNIIGRISFPATIDGKQVNLSFYLAENFFYNFLMGRSTMQSLNATISFTDRTFKVNPQTEVYLHKPITLPPKSAAIVYAKIKEKIPDGFKGLFTPLTKYASNTEKLCLIDTISRSSSQKFPVEVTNYSHQFITLTRNAHLGSFQGLDQTSSLHDLSDTNTWGDYIHSLLQADHPDQVSQHSCAATASADQGQLSGHDDATSEHEPTQQTKVAHLVDFSKCFITPEQKQLLIDLIEEYADIFSTPDNPPTGCTADPHVIHLKPGTLPISGRYIRVPPPLKPVLEEILHDYLRLGFIEPSNSEWASSCMLIKKPLHQSTPGVLSKNAYRLVIDMSLVGQHVIKPYFPMPKITEILEDVAGHGNKLFSSLDLESGYFQVKLSKASRPITAFMANNKKYQFCRLTQGMACSSYKFQKTMVQVLEGTRFTPYLDDISYGCQDFNEFMQQTRILFDRLRKFNLKAKPSKFHPCCSELKILGYVVNKYGVKPCPKKVEVIQNTPVPKTRKQMRAFLGLCNFFRRHIKNYADICHPLYAMTSVKKKFTFGQEQQKAFELLKDAMVKACLLTVPDFSKPYVLITDGATCGLGATLTQYDSEGHLRPICFASRRTNKGESTLSATHLELLAVAWALRFFSDYLAHSKVILYTDHKALLNLLKTFQHPHTRAQRYLYHIQPFDLEARYIRGVENTVSDMLSRYYAMAQKQPVSDADLTEKMNTNVISQYPIEQHSDTDKHYCSYMTLRPRTQKAIQQDTPNDTQNDTTKIKSKKSKSKITKPNTVPKQQAGKTPIRDATPPPDNPLPAATDTILVPSQTADAEVNPVPTAANDNDPQDHNINPSQTDKEPQITLDLSAFRKYLPLDPYYGKLYTALTSGEMPTDRNVLRKIHRDYQNYVVKDNLLYFIYKPTGKVFDKSWQFLLVVPQQLRQKVLYCIHSHPAISNCHAGQCKTLQRLYQNKLFWFTMNKDVIEYIASCEPCCQYKKSRQPQAPYMPMDNSTLSFGSHLHIDMFSNLKTSPEGFQNLLVLTCRFSKLVIFVALKKGKANEVAKAIIDNWILLFGVPRYLIADNAQNFASKIVASVCSLLGIKQIFITPLRPQANSAAETKMKHIKRVLSTYLFDHSDWPSLIKFAQSAYNSTVCQSTQLSPNMIVFGREIATCFSNVLEIPDNMPSSVQAYAAQLKHKITEIDKYVSLTLTENQTQAIAQKNKERKLITYKMGQMVAILQPTIPARLRKFQTNKLYRPYKTGYRICEIVSPIHYRLFCVKSNKPLKKLTHVDRIRPAPIGQNQPYYKDILQEDSTNDDTSNSSDKHESVNAIQAYVATPRQVSKLLAKRKLHNEWYIRVSYVNFDQEYNEWIPLFKLSDDIQALVKLMWHRLPSRSKRRA